MTGEYLRDWNWKNMNAGCGSAKVIGSINTLRSFASRHRKRWSSIRPNRRQRHIDGDSAQRGTAVVTSSTRHDTNISLDRPSNRHGRNRGPTDHERASDEQQHGQTCEAPYGSCRNSGGMQRNTCAAPQRSISEAQSTGAPTTTVVPSTATEIPKLSPAARSEAVSFCRSTQVSPLNRNR